MCIRDRYDRPRDRGCPTFFLSAPGHVLYGACSVPSQVPKISEKTIPNQKNKSTSKSSQVPIGTQEARIRNDRQAVFQVVRDLVQAQFARGDEELTKRLWQDVADRKIDLDRVINLMYTCSFHEDDEEMTNVDEIYQKTGLVG